MDNSSNILWGSPALKDNNNFGLNRRNINIKDNTVVSVNTNQGNDNNEESGPLSTTRLPWGSPLSPVGPYFSNPVSSSSPKTPNYASDKKHVSSRNYCGGGRNNLHDSGGGGSRHPHHFQQQYTGYTPRYTSSSSSSSPVTPFAGRGRSSSSSSYHSSFSSSTQTHGGSSPACKQNRSGSNNNTQFRNSSSFFSTPKISSSFYQKSPYCSPNSPNFSFNQSFSAEDYFKPSMLEDPWEKLRKKKNL